MQDASHSPRFPNPLAKSLAAAQYYHVTVLGTANAALLSVVSFAAVEALGEPYRITIQLTHPQQLDRADYLGRDASFSIAAGLHAPRIFTGCITHFNKLKQTHDFHSYEFVIEPLVARLRLTKASRVFQKQTAPQIIEAILRRHDFNGNQFQFKTRRTYPEHAFRLQYQLSDWDFIHLLMQQEGLYSYFTPGKFGDIIVFGDDIDHYIYKPELKVPYRETAGLEANTETVFSLQTQSQTVPASYRVADYHPADAWERFKEEANIARADKTTCGQPYVYGSHHLNQKDAKWEAQLRHEAAIARQIVYTGESNILELRPARILRMDQALPDAPNGQVIVSVTHSGARDAAYKNSYTAIPSDRRYRIPLDEANWPKIAGTLSARVTSPGKYPHAYITKHGHYTVRFDLDFDEWHPGGESVPLRLAKPFAGANETGFHFPIIDGTEAAIAFMDGKGVFISADLQTKAGGKQLDMQAAQTMLNQLQAQAQGLAQAAAVAKAEVADLQQQNDWLRNSVAELKEAVLLLSSPAGIAAATPRHINLSAGQDIMQRSGDDHSISVGKRFLLAASQGLSMFAHKMGIKLFAARGKIQIQAQSDNLEMIGQQDVQITSAAGKTVVNAANGVILHGGGSAYIKVLGDNVEIGGAGKLNLKIGSVAKDGPGAMSLPLPAFQQKTIPQTERYVLMDEHTQRPLTNHDYRIRLADGSVATGTTDDQGRTILTQSQVARGITLLTERFKDS